MSNTATVPEWTEAEEESFREMEAKRNAAIQKSQKQKVADMLRQLAAAIESGNEADIQLDLSPIYDERFPLHMQPLPSRQRVTVILPYRDGD